MEPSLGWTLLSRDALRQAETLARSDVQGVRDEVGFLALHQAYADRFFPGTSVQHTRLRYALFVPWIYEQLMAEGVRERISESVSDAEVKLAGQLLQSGESGIIGKEKYPNNTSQPPCLVYWSALGSWRILRPLVNGSYPSRTAMHRRMGRRTSQLSLKDDDKQLMHEETPLFASLPKPPKAWGKTSEPLNFRLLAGEKKFLANQLMATRRPDSTEPSLLSRLVEANVVLDENSEMWSDDVRQLADDADRAALMRANQVAALSAIGRGVYAALVETMKDDETQGAAITIHRDTLQDLIAEYAADALELNVADVRLDAGNIGTQILDVLYQTQSWVRGGGRELSDLFDVYCKAESKRKGPRARLPRTLLAREKRLEWCAEEHPEAQPLHYRWNTARGFLRDLFVVGEGGDNG
ncbi:MAG: DUF6361 family protein [Aureliella sp.]